MIKTRGGPVVALCHLQQGSIRVELVNTSKWARLSNCGNTGNSTEPHLHLQAISSIDVMRATALPITLPGGLPRNGEAIDAK